MMKKTLIIVNTCLLIVFLAACGTQNNSTNEPPKNNPTENNKTAGDIQQDNTQQNDTQHDESQNEPNREDTNTTDAKSQDDMKNMMEALNFKEIEIEISYGHDKEYNAEIEHHDNGDVQAELEDELNGIEINDDIEAFNAIYPKAKQLDITQQTSKEDVIQQVLSAFDLENNYEKFKVKIKFNDGKKVSFED